MSSVLITSIICGCLIAAVLLGRGLRRYLPEHHLGGDSREAVKTAIGMVATMAALLLGLLVASAKGAYDAQRTTVLQASAKIAFIDRVLGLYGPDASDIRTQLRSAVDTAIRDIWRDHRDKIVDTHAGDLLYGQVQQLKPQDEVQRTLKNQCLSSAIELAQLRTLLQAQSAPSISRPMLFIVVAWLVVIFMSFGLLAPPNLTTVSALAISAISVTGALFLILELDRPFSGWIQIPSDPMRNALVQ